MSLWHNMVSFMGFDTEEEYLSNKSPSLKINETINRAPAQPRPGENKLRMQKAALIDFQASKKGKMPINSQTEMILCEPKKHEDSVLLSTYIKEGKPVIVNLKYLDAAAGKRLIDFVCGTVYAFEGQMQKLGSNIFLFTPNCFNIVNKKHDTYEFQDGSRSYAEETMQQQAYAPMEQESSLMYQSA